MWRLLALGALGLLGVQGARPVTSVTSLLQLKTESHEVALIPAPQEVRLRHGQLRKERLAVQAPPRLLRVVEQFMGPVESAKPWLILQLHGAGHEEGYLLNVSDAQVLIQSPTEHGLFNGLMTLRQLVEPGGGWTVPKVEIVDKPAFRWRGLMLDVSRHFFPPSAVKHLLKTMALFKMNHFHWHLTDDQGWRFPVAKYPKLISLGAARRGTQLGHSSATDGVAYNHSYSEEEVEDILSLAESLYIEVLPEFDLPGHSQAAVASYPDLGNADVENWRPEVATNFGALQYTLSPAERSVNFTKDVLSEMAQLFVRSPYVHIGGDEVPTEQWARSSVALAVAREKDLDLKHLEGMMLEQAAGHLQSLHKNAVVWDDALDGGGVLPKDTVVMIWRSWEGLDKVGNKAHLQGHKVVLAPQAYTYLDQWQDAKHKQFDAIGGYLPLQKVYRTPTTAGDAEVLGLQGQLWSEYIKGEKNLDYMAWPRGCALAEVAWSGEARPGYRNFKKRLLQRLKDFKLFQHFDMSLDEI